MKWRGLCHGNTQPYLATFRELQPIAYQVQQDLSQATGIAEELWWYAGVGVQQQAQAFLFGS